MPEPQRENLCRSAPFRLVRTDGEGGGDGFTLDGYGAVFDQVTEIDSWEGRFEETIARGAFRKSLRERTPRLQFDHGRHPLIGSIPIGRITSIAEDDHGLHVVARLSDNWLVQPVREAIGEESIDGMSFRFSVIRDEWRDAAGKLVKPGELEDLLYNPGDRAPIRRTLKEVSTSEVGPVVWPAYEGTNVGVRTRQLTIDLGRLGEAATRKELARMVFLADAAQEPATHRTVDAPPLHQDSADPHPSDDAPQVTEPSPEEHPSVPPLSKSAAARVREHAQACRGYLLSVEGKLDARQPV